MAQICVSLIEATTEALVDRMVDLASVADLFEIRADHCQDLDLLMLLRTRTRPLVLTCRPPALGGRFEGGEERRRALLLEGVRRGFDFVDVEHDAGFGEVLVEKAGHGLILSHHDFERTPDDLDALYERLRALGADVAKLATTPESWHDVGRLMTCAAEAARMGGPPVVPIAMGPLGAITRVTAGRHGAPFTYASAAAGAEAAPGQIPARELAQLYRVRDITRATRVYGLLGAAVGASLSPLLHNSAFAARGLDAVYVPLQADALAPFLSALPALGLSGFSVTRPFKVAIAEHLATLDPAAARSGSINTVTIDGPRLRGASTDGQGVLAPLRQRLDPQGQRVVIVGAGGAARAAAHALAAAGAEVTLAARRPEQAVEAAGAAACAPASLADLAHLHWDVLINATPLGSFEQPDASPVPAHLLRPGRLVFDMVYQPLETRLLREARAAGCTVIDGLEMLVAQAAAQFELWLGQPAPDAAMRAAAAAHLVGAARATEPA